MSVNSKPRNTKSPIEQITDMIRSTRLEIILAVFGLLGALVGTGIVRPVDAELVSSLVALAAILIPALYILSKKWEPDVKETLVKLVGKYGAFQTGKYSLEHRGKTAHYVVYLSVLFNKGQAQAISELMANLITQSNVEFDRVVGILMRAPGESLRTSREGYHLAPVVASMLKRPYVLLYEARDENTGELCFFQDGELLPKERVVIIDDVLTTGASIINAVNYLRRVEGKIAAHDAFVFLSRPHGKTLEAIQKQFEQMDVTLHSMIDSKELLQKLYQQGFIGQEELKEAYQDPDFEGLTPPV